MFFYVMQGSSWVGLARKFGGADLVTRGKEDQKIIVGYYLYRRGWDHTLKSS